MGARRDQAGEEVEVRLRSRVLLRDPVLGRHHVGGRHQGPFLLVLGGARWEGEAGWTRRAGLDHEEA
eukprot:11618990-Alexandrium_andersonii.AAC.1